MNPDILVPICFFLVSLFAFRAWLKHAHLGRLQIHQSLRTAFEHGASIPPEALHRLTRAADPRRADLRQCIVMIALAVALILLAMLLPFDDEAARQAFAALAVIPGILGLTHLTLWRFWHGWE